MISSNNTPNDSENDLWYKMVIRLEVVTGKKIDPRPFPGDNNEYYAENFLNILDLVS